jgi:hypothetical protein
LQNAFDIDAREFRLRAEVPGHQLPVEAVDSGGNGSVGREDRPGPDRLQCCVEFHVVIREFVNSFQTEESRVALVRMEHLGPRVAREAAVGPYGTHPADAEQHLLEEPVLAAAAVEPVRHAALAEVVLLHVRVEHQQRDPADLGQPDAGVEGFAAGEGQGHLGGCAVGLAQEGHGQFVRVQDRIVLLLPAVPGQRLAEVAVPVEESDADQGYAEVAGRLEMVPGEDAEAAGVLRQRGRDAELGREVGDGGGKFGGLGLVPAVAGHVVVQVVGGRGEPSQEAPVLRQLGQPSGRHAPEEAYGIAFGGGPALGVHGLEEVTGLGMPGPAQIARQIAEGVKGFGEYGTHGESADGLHELPPSRRTYQGGVHGRRQDPAGPGRQDLDGRT